MSIDYAALAARPGAGVKRGFVFRIPYLFIPVVLAGFVDALGGLGPTL